MKHIVFIFALATFAAHGSSVGTAKFGDLGMNDNVVTNVDLSGISMTEEDPYFSQFKQQGGTMYGPLKFHKPMIGGMDFTTTISSNGVSFWKYTPAGAGGYWSEFSFDWDQVLVGESDPTVPAWAKSPTPPLTSESDPTVPAWAKTQNKPSYTASEVGAAPASVTNEMDELRTENALVYRLYQGSNVVAEVTNYNSQVHAPELRIMQLNESNEYVTVWAETNGLSRTFAASTNAAATMVQGERTRSDNAYAPKAWSRTTSGLGAEAPSNTTWISTQSTIIAGGLEPQKNITSGGEIWIVTANGMVADFHPLTNNTAFLDIASADGTSMFRIEKTDAYLVGVHVTDVTVDDNALVCGVKVLSEDHPLVRIKPTLTANEWSKEEVGIPASLATVTWTGSSGDWTCRIENNTGGTSLFAYMEYVQQGGTKIVNEAAMDITQGIYVNGVKFIPSVSGNNLIWTKQP